MNRADRRRQERVGPSGSATGGSSVRHALGRATLRSIARDAVKPLEEIDDVEFLEGLRGEMLRVLDDLIARKRAASPSPAGGSEVVNRA